MKRKQQMNVIEVLHQRYIGDDAEQAASLEEERIINTTQSVISRMEDADYEGRSLTMLHRIAKAPGKDLLIDFRQAHRSRQS